MKRDLLPLDPSPQNPAVSGVRIDKWLWAARFFKTRALASRACELGRIQCNGQPARPSRNVRLGDQLQIRNDSADFHVAVTAISAMRGPAAAAQALYCETDASRELRLKAAADRKAMFRFEGDRETKPSKRDRRELERFRGR